MPKVTSWKTTVNGLIGILCGIAGIYVIIVYMSDYNWQVQLVMIIFSTGSIGNGMVGVFSKDATVTNSSPTGEAIKVK